MGVCRQLQSLFCRIFFVFLVATFLCVNASKSPLPKECLCTEPPVTETLSPSPKNPTFTANNLELIKKMKTEIGYIYVSFFIISCLLIAAFKYIESLKQDVKHIRTCMETDKREVRCVS